MVKMFGWINVYKSGLYHQAGKPSAFDRHGGDVYSTRASAMSARSPEELVVGEPLLISWWEEDAIRPNPGPDGLLPVSIAINHREFDLPPDPVEAMHDGHVKVAMEPPAKEKVKAKRPAKKRARKAKR